ncbi:hypothetical protein [Candidatus Nitrosocosmicus hydrocola]|nr:hypothetical protein [Candidatus Nitrosocosmicus hydrocola]
MGERKRACSSNSSCGGVDLLAKVVNVSIRFKQFYLPKNQPS